MIIVLYIIAIIGYKCKSVGVCLFFGLLATMLLCLGIGSEIGHAIYSKIK